MRFLFVLNSLDEIQPSKDTSFALMRAAVARGHEVVAMDPEDLSLIDGQVRFEGVAVEPDEQLNPPFKFIGETQGVAEELSAVFIRTDPPFDAAYLHATWVLDHLPETVYAINSPSGIRTVNEKIWATQFMDLVPKTLVTSDMALCQQFIETENEVIVKPTDGFGGQSVIRLNRADPNRRVVCEMLSAQGRIPIIVQRYISAAQHGDKRILLLNGEPLGAIMRIHADGEHRNNIAAGGRTEPAEITDRDNEIIAALKPHLRRLELEFVGIDVIGDYLIEVNVTSPTCLQEMSAFGDADLAAEVIAFVEDRVAAASLN